jgi:hypothetical protein
MSIEAMKLALEALKDCRRDPRLKYEHKFHDKVIKALEEALAKQEQGEAVGEIECIDIDEDGQPSAWLKLYDNVELGDLLYTTPQQRKPLTDEQTNKAAMKLAECMDYPWTHMPEEGKREMRKHAKAVIEAAHGIKE